MQGRNGIDSFLTRQSSNFSISTLVEEIYYKVTEEHEFECRSQSKLKTPCAFWSIDGKNWMCGF